MASTKSTELSATEIELKRRGRRRLIGAGTIGLLGIVFLPMIFDGESKRSSSGSTLKRQEISIQVPAKDGQPPLSAPSTAPVAPLPATPAAALPLPAAPVVEPATPPAATKAAPEVIVSKTVPTVAPPGVEKPAAVEKAPPAAANKKGFAVQLGAFGDADKAQLAVAAMKNAKLPVYTESIAAVKGTVTRVRVGPFATREKADSALAQIKLAGSDGKIIPLQ